MFLHSRLVLKVLKLTISHVDQPSDAEAKLILVTEVLVVPQLLHQAAGILEVQNASYIVFQ